jgi:hypothetical protein
VIFTGWAGIFAEKSPAWLKGKKKLSRDAVALLALPHFDGFFA